MISLTNVSSNIDNVLASLKLSDGVQKMDAPGHYRKTKKHSALEYGLNDAGEPKRPKKNVTPAPNKPYCRYKEFSKMPQYSLDAVSKTEPSKPTSCSRLDCLLPAMHPDQLELRGQRRVAIPEEGARRQAKVDEREGLQDSRQLGRFEPPGEGVRAKLREARPLESANHAQLQRASRQAQVRLKQTISV